MKRSFLLLPLLSLLHIAGGLARAEDPSTDTATTRRVDTQNAGAGSEVLINQIDTSGFPKVNIFATVLKGGEPVNGLTAADFRVREDEVDQEPLTVLPKLVALNAVVTVDTSGSIKKALPEVQQAASSFIDILGAEDKFTVIGFAREVKVLSSSGDKAKAKAAIEQTVARGDTALYDAIYETVSRLKDVKGRKAAILLTDGVDDNGEGKQLSKHSIDDGLRLAKEVNVPVFTVGLGAEVDEKILKRIATETGAKYFLAPKSSDLKQLYDVIGKQLMGQYSIQYSSNLPADGTAHRVNLSQGSAFGTKEYMAPGTAVVRATAEETTTAVTTTAAATATVSEVKKTAEVVTATVKVPPGLHVRFVPVEGGEPMSVDRVLVYPDLAFENPNSIASQYNTKDWSTNLAPGKYRLKVEKGNLTREVKFEMPADQGLNQTVVLNAGIVRAVARMASSGENVQIDRFEVQIPQSDGTVRHFDAGMNRNLWTVLVPAGSMKIVAERGAAKAEKIIEVAAGAQVDVQLELNSGMLNAIATLTSGSPKVRVERFSIYPKTDAFSERKTLDSSFNRELWSIALPAGKFELEVQLGNAFARNDIEVTSGAVLNQTVVLNAGELEVIATQSKGGPRVTVEKFYVKRPGNGFDEPKVLDSRYNTDRYATVLNAGEYLIGVTLKGGGTHEVKATIEAGKKLQQEIVLTETK